ncbi:hypothetical protein NZD89_20145 [Alicyclobacillus fastidiosus]|uniref:Tetratricopeptide repeat protein n=1 Tax=Alicyclobacillus fastidiosus TaxID=392011 RepID=A0ABY6ZCL7_9BACL|nr:hypothetical protein [Alicyclobacillus fastidiosus]WAH40606.1 hypothetical protein NZD89_20145 [Alicyclobacillus fastidiosus]GMA62046.1 hypothetical protein GCM10025859_24860 [Alicyclobacillus fastidiosus]
MNASSVLDEFIQKTEAHPLENHNDLLFHARDLLEAELIVGNYPIKTVRLAYKLYGYLGDNGLAERINVMSKFLRSGHGSLDDQFWAKWVIVDNLALLKRYTEMVKEHQEFLIWAKSHMEPVYWIKVMSDSTQAEGWFELGMTEMWFEIYHDSMSKVVPEVANRCDRIYYMETAIGLLVEYLHKYEPAIPEIERYRGIINEDPLWTEYDRFSIRLKSYELGLYSKLNQWDKYDEIIAEATAMIQDRAQRYERGEFANIDEICDMAHEVGCCLMWEKRYDQALPLFEYAIANQGVGVTHYFYAMCVWATEKNRSKTMHHLHMAQKTTKGNQGLRSRYKHMFLDTPEFADVHDDVEFLLVFSE